MAMSYGNVYVAQIAMGADMNQTIRAIKEAESYPGPSIIIGYSPCISHGIKTGMGTSIMEERRAVEAGYWHLYRYNPFLRRRARTLYPGFQGTFADYREFIQGEIRYSSLANVFPEYAEDLYEQSKSDAEERYRRYKLLSEHHIL